MARRTRQKTSQNASRELILLETDRAARAAVLALRLAAVGELELRRVRRAAKRLGKAHPRLSCFDLAWLIAAQVRLRDGRSGPLHTEDSAKVLPGRPAAYGAPALRGRPPVARNAISAALISARRRARYTRILLAEMTGLDIVGLERARTAPYEVLEPGAEILRRALHLSEAQLCSAELGTWNDEELQISPRTVSWRQLPLFDQDSQPPDPRPDDD